MYGMCILCGHTSWYSMNKSIACKESHYKPSLHAIMLQLPTNLRPHPCSSARLAGDSSWDVSVCSVAAGSFGTHPPSQVRRWGNCPGQSLAPWPQMQLPLRGEPAVSLGDAAPNEQSLVQWEEV